MQLRQFGKGKARVWFKSLHINANDAIKEIKKEYWGHHLSSRQPDDQNPAKIGETE